MQVQQLLLDSSPSTSASSNNNSKSRPKVNLQKAAEYSCQVQGERQQRTILNELNLSNLFFSDIADSPSRRVLLDYPSPYLYGNYHTSPSEDLVALWFGGNGTGQLILITIFYYY